MPLFIPNIPSSSSSSAATYYVNVKNAPFNAKGDGTTDDTAAVKLAIASVSKGGTIFFPAGTYMISSSLSMIYDGIHFLGAGKQATILMKKANCDLIDMSGTGQGPTNHIHHCSIKEMTLHGNNFIGKLVRCYYTSLALFDSLLFYANQDIGVETVEMYDSYFQNCFWDYCGDVAGTVPSVYIKNAATSSGFGFSTDSSNMIWFVNCHWEDFYGGALWVDALNGNTNNPNGIFLVNCKMETTLIAGGPFLKFAASTIQCYVENLYVSGDSFKSGYSTPIDAIQIFGRSSSLQNVFINANAAVFSSGVNVSPTSPLMLSNISGFGTACTVAFINMTGGATVPVNFEAVRCVNGTLFANNTGGTISPLKSFDDTIDTTVVTTDCFPDLLNVGNTIIFTATSAFTVHTPAMVWKGATLKFLLISNATGLYTITWAAVFKATTNYALPTAMPGPNLALAVTFVSDGTNWYRVS